MDMKKNNQSLLIGVTGIVIQVGGLIAGGLTSGSTSPSNPDFMLILIAWAGILVGTGLLIWGMCLFAQAKEQSGWWGLMGLLGIIGLIVLSTLPDRHAQRHRARQLNADITRPPEENSVRFSCFSCGYTLNGVTSGACPECGRPFDPANLATVLVDDPSAEAKPPWTSRWSLICGFLGIATFCIPVFGMIIPGLGVLFGHMAIVASKKTPQRLGLGVAIAGLVLSYLTMLAGIAVFASIILSASGVI